MTGKPVFAFMLSKGVLSLRSVLSFPLVLTFLRLLLAPFTVPFLIIYLGTSSYCFVHIILATIFIFFSITDFFDGYLARRFNQVSALGKILDPVADKCLLYATLIGLLVIERIHVLWVIVFIEREIFIMGLRSVALEYGVQVPVSFLGKLKTCSQMLYLTILIIKPCAALFMNEWQWYFVQQGALVVALGLSLGSAYLYYRGFMREVIIGTYEGDTI